jgi:hypothetical protein
MQKNPSLLPPQKGKEDKRTLLRTTQGLGKRAMELGHHDVTIE